MANVTPRRKARPAAPQRGKKEAATPWSKGDPTRKYGLNTPISEPLMLMLDYLVENRVIFSKASFIRDVVTRAAEEEIKRLGRVREAVRQIDEADGRSHRSQKPRKAP